MNTSLPPSRRLLLNAMDGDQAALADVLLAFREQGYAIESAGTLDEVAAVTPPCGVLTVWSRRSLLDERVVAIADLALQADCLIPIRIEDVAPPIGFRQAQTHDLVSLSAAAGLELVRKLRRAGPAGQPAAAAGGTRRGMRWAALEWTLFVVPAIATYTTVFSALAGGMSSYIVFLFGALLVVTSALVGTPRFLRGEVSDAPFVKLCHCGRVDLGVQLLLVLGLGLFGLSVESVKPLATGLLAGLQAATAAAAALVVRHFAVALWLAWRAGRARAVQAGACMLLFVLPAWLAFWGVARLLLAGFFPAWPGMLIALSATQAIVFGVPAVAAAGGGACRGLRENAVKLSMADAAAQAGVSVAGAILWHLVVGAPTAQAMARLGACAAAGILVRYLGICIAARRKEG